MSKYILAFDQGTTSSRAIIFNHQGKAISTTQREFKQIFPKPGWVEHDPNEIWSTQIGVAAEAVSKSKLKSEDIQAIGITNQRETTVVWDRNTGEPVYNAIVWQDRRTSDYCDELREQGYEDMVRKKTGLVIDAYFVATKVKWILDNIEGARSKADNGDLIFGTIDSWLVWNLTGGESHITDITNASRTMLYNIQTLEWDDELLKLFEIPSSMLPTVVESSGPLAVTSGAIFSKKIPITGIAGDQHAALFGQMCLKPGMIKNTYGTGCFMLMNIGEKPIVSENRLVTTIAWKINGKVSYALEGSIFIAGAVVQWLRDGMQMISSASEIEDLASAVDNTNGVYFVPAFTGLGAPYWNQHARGTITGITRGSTKNHIARAALESIAFQTYDVLKAMEADANIEIKELRVDGGATENDLLMQFQADILKTKILRSQTAEVTALGAAYLAGLGSGYWKNISEVEEKWEESRAYNPENINLEELINGWKRAIKAANSWSSN
ncbi:glycerol kinase GlpK [Christiangramia flava]|uniref:Glycerol kinase n=1 Tax=Christiangramia flava JLT2011 TaxID=1229726 RepID=A0A1L7I1T9_9FLAO|nr:glycerol kinase GlpK [Christiangramia flava]APU67588.1 Glycerol kinase [Christiangramia flava JLT2011]OSS40173.1 Glycerol kinase [Christiangramia flava JLT2011]